MSLAYGEVRTFWDYLEYYPDEDEHGYDGIHHGGIKGICLEAPEKAKQEYEQYLKSEKICKEKKVKL